MKIRLIGTAICLVFAAGCAQGTTTPSEREPVVPNSNPAVKRDYGQSACAVLPSSISRGTINDYIRAGQYAQKASRSYFHDVGRNLEAAGKAWQVASTASDVERAENYIAEYSASLRKRCFDAYGDR